LIKGRKILQIVTEGSLSGRIAVLLVVLSFFINNLKAQVITNSGAEISLTSGVFIEGKDLNNNSGSLANDGTVKLSGNYNNSGLTKGNGFYLVKGNWTDLGIFNAGTSKVTLNGTANQTIWHGSSGETFYILEINNPGKIITQISAPGSALIILSDLDITAGTLRLGQTTSILNIGGHAIIGGSLSFNDITTQIASIKGDLGGTGSIDMSSGDLPHTLNLSGAINSIGLFTTSPASSSTVNYNGSGPTQSVFPAINYRNLIISNSGIKTLQGNSVVGLNLSILGGTFDLGMNTTSLNVFGNTIVKSSLTFNGTTVKNVSLLGNLSGTGLVDMSGGNLAHLLNLNGTSNSIGSYFSGDNSTVFYTLNGDQTMFISDDYRNLKVTGSGNKTLSADITAKGILTMSAGNIDACSFTLSLSNPAVAALIHTNGTIKGKLIRAIGVTGSEYLYPVGTLTSYNPLNISFNNLTAGPLTVQFKAEDIGTTGLPLDDDGNEIYDRVQSGYWSLTSVSPLTTGSYNVKLNYNGFLGVDLSSSVIKRTDGGNLELDGAHGSVSGTEITRATLANGISSNVTDLAIGKGRPRIVNQPDFIDICENSNAFFEVRARGRGVLTYQWQVNTGSGFTNLTNGGVYSDVNTDKLILTSAPYGMNGYRYRCIITDGQGHPKISDEALLTVNKIPEATATPSAQNECSGVAFTNIMLGTSNSVTGTTFAWTRNNPDGIVTTMSMSGSATGDMITGVFSNTTDAPVTVTFIVVPTGPSTTFCIGNPITINVTVNPVPRVFGMPASSIQCDKSTTDIRLTSPSVFTSGAITFKYTVTSTGSVSGFTSPVSGLPDEHHITDLLVNNTDTFRIVTYRIVPVSPVGCIDGMPIEVKVKVNPTPRAIPVNNLPEICYGGSTQVVLRSPTKMTSGAIKFDYTVSFSDAGAVSGSVAPVANLNPNYVITLPYTNNSGSIQSVYFSITPRVDNAICVPGPVYISEVKVHAKPLQSIAVTKPLTCASGAGLASLKAIISTGAAPYDLAWRGPVGYHAEDLIDINNLPSGRYDLEVTDNLGCNNKLSKVISPVFASAVLAVDNKPSGFDISCIDSHDGEMWVYVQGGITPPYTYEVLKNNSEVIGSGVFLGNFALSDLTTYRIFTHLGPGNYKLKITDINGCEDIESYDFKVPPQITATISKTVYDGGYNVKCRGYNDGAAWISSVSGGVAGYTYRWFTTDGTIPGSLTGDRIDNITAGTYYVEIKDSYNCTKIESVTINQPDGMDLIRYNLSKSPDNNYNISCNGGNDGKIEIFIEGGSGNYLYNWSSPNGFTATTANISGLKAGGYSCTVKDVNGCILVPTPAYNLTEPAPLNIAKTLSVSDDGAYNINCNGGTGFIKILVSGGSTGNYIYDWSTLDGSGIVQGQKDQPALTAGTYHLKVTDGNNCMIEKDITLTQPPELGLHLTAKDISCETPGFRNGSINLSVSGGTGAFTYSWSNGSTSEDISGLTEGLYNVNVTYNNTCSKSASVQINLPQQITYNKSIRDFNGYNITCNGMANGAIKITPTSGKAPFNYLWTGPGGFVATKAELTGLRAGQYTLVVTDSNYCSVSEVFNLTQPGKLGVNFDLSESIAGNYNVNCAGDSSGSITANAINAVNIAGYLWSDGFTGAIRTGLPAGSYSVIVTDANNCQAFSTVSITQPDSLRIEFDVKKPFCPDMPDGEIHLDVTGGVKGTDYIYRWSDKSTERNLGNVVKGNYKVIVRDMNGCTASDSVKVVPENEVCLGIPNIISPNNDLINDVWNIELIDLYPNSEVVIMNRWGEVVWKSEKGYPKPWDGKSNGRDLPIDSYHYIIDLHNGERPYIGNVTIVR
jgi:gliding motility-associated-like protein